MRVLMLGWEFPPFISGGLGTACYGLTKALSALGVEVLFVLPRSPEQAGHTHVRFLNRRRGRRVRIAPVRFRAVPSTLRPYVSTEPPDAAALRRGDAFAEEDPLAGRSSGPLIKPAFAGPGGIYDGDVVEKARQYAELVVEVAADEDFDVIHAHDWMTFPAAQAVAARTRRPMIAHVHATEFDRSGEGVHPEVAAIERAGPAAADRTVAVSRLTKNQLVERYGLAPDNIDVVYNAILSDRTFPRTRDVRPPHRREKVVLFLGRITRQKGPEYFLLTARKLLEAADDVRFVVAGHGDMFGRMVELAATLGIGHRVFFTGFLRGADVERAYRLSDVYVMPSVSEPFGLTPLEAMLRGVPTIISRQSGVAEVVRHSLKVDFWDTHGAADRLAALLRDPVLYKELSDNGLAEARTFDWRGPARALLGLYRRVASGPAVRRSAGL